MDPKNPIPSEIEEKAIKKATKILQEAHDKIVDYWQKDDPTAGVTWVPSEGLYSKLQILKDGL